MDKLKTIPVYLNKLNDVVKNEGVIKTVYNKLVKKVNAFHTIDTIDLFLKADCETNIPKIKYLAFISITLHKNLLKFWVQYLMND